MDRAEHPKPQFVRKDWMNLNGIWKYAFDFGLSGEERKWYDDVSDFKGDINVPFCPESELSGVKYVDFINGIWYTRTFKIPKEWKGDRVFIHFGAVDYKAVIYINGKKVGFHIGPVSFAFDITEYLKRGENRVVVFAEDKKEEKPRGKQSNRYYRYGCLYTRVTGIWQTVWLERRPNAYIDSVKTVSDFDNSAFVVTPTFKNIKQGDTFTISVKGDGKEYSKTVKAQSGIPVSVDIEKFIPWTPKKPFLYDVEYNLNNEDVVKSYMGMRKVHIEGNKYYLNNKELFIRFVLDQGYYRKGIWTAPSDEDLKKDIELSLAAGFNGARLHQKVFEERFLYHADKLGYMVWAEHCDWGFNFDDFKSISLIKDSFMEEMKRDYNHPSIIAWTPFNETTFSFGDDRESHDISVQGMVNLIRAYDPTRPVNDTSGLSHVDTDIYTIHDYEQDPKKLRDKYKEIKIGVIYENEIPGRKRVTPYKGQPFINDEYGGTMWAPNDTDKDTWGYSGNKDIEEVYAKIRDLTKAMVDNPLIAGFCYTQLTDVEQEKNGIYDYDRNKKFDMKKIKSYFLYKRKV